MLARSCFDGAPFCPASLRTSSGFAALTTSAKYSSRKARCMLDECRNDVLNGRKTVEHTDWTVKIDKNMGKFKCGEMS